ncbi:MAG: Holliday junction branch migration protein RuvA, partial [Patescibacteria group bacterium]
MISYLKGKILNKDNGYVILAVNDIGYKVFVNPAIYALLDIGQPVELYTHQHVREDSLDLYGFKNMAELEMFELLLSISGIGPKSALGVLAIADVNQVKESITRGDPSLLTKVSGIGRKTAERVVLELREKITSLAGGASIKTDSGVMASGDEIDALIALGYSMQQAREALSQVDPKIKDSGERIKEALRK